MYIYELTNLTHLPTIQVGPPNKTCISMCFNGSDMSTSAFCYLKEIFFIVRYIRSHVQEMNWEIL